MVSVSAFQKACFSSLLHDLRVAKSCLGFHVRNPFNPVSLHFSSDLSVLYEAVSALYREVHGLCSHPGAFVIPLYSPVSKD